MLRGVMESTASQIARQVGQLKVLIVDDEPSMRRVTRALLQAIGVRQIWEASDGSSGLSPSACIARYRHPRLGNAEPEWTGIRARRARPGQLSAARRAGHHVDGHSERSCVVEAMRAGVNEYLLKPVSSTALLARIVSIISKPRRMMKQGDYYGPEPRKLSSYKPESDRPVLRTALSLSSINDPLTTSAGRRRLRLTKRQDVQALYRQRLVDRNHVIDHVEKASRGPSSRCAFWWSMTTSTCAR